MLKHVTSYLTKFLTNISKSSPRIVLTSAPQPFNENDPAKEKFTRRPKKTINSDIKSRYANTRPGSKMPTSSTDFKLIPDDRIVWMDLEMTGLDITKDVIMEVGCIITGPNLEEVARLAEIIINVPGALLDSMDPWCISTHGGSGLTQACRNSIISNLDAEEKLLQFLQQHTKPGISLMGGNSITYDRIFLNKFMPRASAQLHYRNIDVSTIKELVRRWYPKEYNESPKKRHIHKTMADIEDSINELKFYRSKIFIPQLPQEAFSECSRKQ